MIRLGKKIDRAVRLIDRDSLTILPRAEQYLWIVEWNTPEKKPREKQPGRDRFTLKPPALDKVNGWLEQVTARYSGLRISRHDIISWLVNSHPPTLSSNELVELHSLHFDELEFAKWALDRLKEGRAQGEKITLTDLLTARPGPKERPPRKAREKKAKAEQKPQDPHGEVIHE